MSPADPPDDAAVLRDLRAAYATARAEVVSTGDLRAAFTLASTLVSGLQSMTDDVAELRHLLAARIYDSEAASLAVLAKQVGMSKSRFDKLVAKGQRVAAEERNEPCAD